jgi:hypothetical protein
VTSVRSDLPDLILTTDIDKETGQTRIVHIDQDRAPQRGIWVGKVVVQTDHPRYNQLIVPVEMIVESQLNVSPPSLLLRAGSAEVSQQAVITAPVPVELVVHESEDASITADLESDESRRKWTVTVRLAPVPSSSGVVRERLLFEVRGLEDENDLTIPVTLVPSS